jgi:predicted transcriptional regulator
MPSETIKVLDRLNTKLAMSDYQLHKLLGVSKATVSRWRVGKGSFSDTTALKIAEILDENPGYMLALAAAERATGEPERKAWTTAAKRLQRSAAAALVGLITLPLSKAAFQLCILC